MKTKRNLKDSLFVDYFCTDKIVGKANFISLYNALHGKNSNIVESDIQQQIIDQAVYKKFNNDIGMIVAGSCLVLIEHQSTINMNMPLRMLQYLCAIYNEILDPKKRYSKRQMTILRPEFYVIYNGREKWNTTELKLSDSFKYYEDSTAGGFIELKVPVYSIRNEDLPLVQKCDKIKEYNRFIRHMEQNVDPNDPNSYTDAIITAISSGIMDGYLERKVRRVKNWFLSGYNPKDELEAYKEDCYLDGMDAGLKQGLEQGIEQGLKQKSIETAASFLSMGLTIQQVAKGVNLSEDAVRKISMGQSLSDEDFAIKQETK